MEEARREVGEQEGGGDTWSERPRGTRITCTEPDAEACLDLRDELSGYDAGTIDVERVDLEGRTGQEFYLERQGYSAVVKYTTPASLDNAIYTLLGSMGFRWYGPGESWTVRPSEIALSDTPGQWLAPTFRNAFCFGTGGLELAAPDGFDPENSYKHDWLRWKRRLRICADFEPPAHSGEAFYQENKELLDAHPEWFNSDSGRVGGRFRVEIPEALRAYTDWIVGRYREHVGSRFVAIGTDPEDGRGGADDPLPPEETGLLNHADKWWHVTNEVAKLYDEDDPRTVVAAYAYGDGPTVALAPSFALRRNVYPVITPYAFQSAYLPVEMIKVWSERVEKMGIYDYWNITQWSLGLPQFDIHALKDRLRLWRRYKVDGVYVETTDGAGAMGHAWWLASQLMFDVEQDFDALYARYLEDCFGAAAPVMRRMYDRWSKNPQGAGEVSHSLHDLAEASAMVSCEGPEWRRLTDLKAYVHYMKMFHEHDGTQASKDAIFHYLYGIHHLRMVQTAAFQSQSYLPPLEGGNVFPEGTGKIVTPQEIEDQFALDLEASPRCYEVLPFELDLARASFLQQPDARAWRYGSNVSMRLFAAESGEVVFDAGSTDTAKLSVQDDEGELLVKEAVGVDDHTGTEVLDDQTWYMKRYSVPVVAGRSYTIDFVGYFSRLTMQSEVVLLKKMGGEDFDNVGYPPMYFYVPTAATEIAFRDDLGSVEDPLGSFMVGPDGEPRSREPTGVKNVYRVAVPEELRGQVWTARFTHSSWSVLSFPGYGSLAPFAYAE